VPKPLKYSNLTDLDLPNNRTKNQSSNHAYCSANNASEKKKAEDFKIFYGKIYEKYHPQDKEEIEIKTIPNEIKIESNKENDGLQSPEKNENIQRKIILSRMKKYKAIIANNEKTQLSNYFVTKNEVRGKKEHSPKNPIRARKFKLLF